ncbi:MAG: terpene cyclase/mutase family protein [Planctomycetes bacterium]|nr:terpene cyclase/mutase family protein [Planctomycetota bacterium]
MRHASIIAAAGAALLAAAVLSGCATARVHRRELPDAIREGVGYLVKSQQPDGSWGTGLQTRGFEIYHSVPGSHDAFKLATTALCVMALREAGEGPAHDRGLEWLVATGDARRDTGDLLYNVWGNTYALQALALELQRKPDPRLRTAAERQLRRLVTYETWMGGWFYYDFDAHTQTPSGGPTSFGTAAGLVALWEARRAGLDVPQSLIDRALRRLEEMRLPDGAFLYGDYLKYYPQHPANRPKGSLGRSQAGNFALWLWGSKRAGAEESRAGLATFFAEHNYIECGRKRQWPHEAWYATAPYYFYFGHYYAARVLEKLGPDGKRDFAALLAETILPNQEPDGSWWDYPMWDYDKPYGTAYAVMILLRCRPPSPEMAITAAGAEAGAGR